MPPTPRAAPDERDSVEREPVSSRTEPIDRGTKRFTGRPGWLVLGFAILTSALTGPGQTIGVSVFIDHFVDDLSLSRSAVSTAYLIGTLTGALLLPSVGQFIDRRGVRSAQMIIGLLFGLALVNMSFVNGLVWLAIGFAGIRFLGQGSLTLVSTVTVQVRFQGRRGTALGIFSTASAASIALVPVALALLISAVGWRSTWLIAAAVVVAIVVPGAWFLLSEMPRRRPRELVVDPALAATTFDRAGALRTTQFWMMASVSGATGMMATAMNFHQIDLLGDAGLSETAAAALFIPQVLGSTIAGLSIGFVADRIGTRYLPAVAMGLLLSAQLLASVAAPGVVVVLYAIVLGSVGGSMRTVSATLLPDWFGTFNIGSIQGALTLFNVGASAIGPVALTLVASQTGSYPPALIILCIVPVAAGIFALISNQRPERLVDKP